MNSVRLSVYLFALPKLFRIIVHGNDVSYTILYYYPFVSVVLTALEYLGS